MLNRNLYTRIAVLLAVACWSCDSTFLDVKPRSNLVVPNSLNDYQQLLDNIGVTMVTTSQFLDVMADDYYWSEEHWNSRNPITQNAHVWATDFFGTEESHSSWSRPYTAIFYANVVLDGLENIDAQTRQANERDYNHIKGSAYFIRGFSLFKLTQLFAAPYDQSTAANELGLPTPVSSDVNEPVRRGTLEATFEHLLSDVKAALPLLNETVDFSRPSTVAAHALLARIYLYMGNFEAARTASDSALANHSALTDYNIEDVRYEDAIYLDFTIGSSVINRRADAVIVPELYDAYADNDLRKSKFFAMNPDGQPYKLNTHGVGLSSHFTGFDTDELFLIRAECATRLGDIEAALDDMNHLLAHRYATGTYVAKTDGSAQEVLAFVLLERRKEMLYRGVRWSDLRRLNVLGANITLTRHLGDQTYRLPPGDARWTLPIPLKEIKTSGIEQNAR